MKKILACLLILSLTLSCFVTVAADLVPDYKPPEKPKEEYTYSVADGEVTLEYQCSYSSVFEIPETIKGYPVTKVEFGNAFVDNVAKVIYIPKTVREIASPLNYGNRGLQTIVVDEDNPYYSSVDGVLYNKEETVLIQYPTAKTGTVTFASTIQEIGKKSFYNNSVITHIVIPGHVKEIKEGAFFCNTALESVVLPEGLTRVSVDSFRGCSQLKTIHFPDSLEIIDNGAFKNCTSLQKVNLPERLTRIGSSAFWNCRSLSSVIIPKSVTEIGNYALGFIDYSSMDCLYWEPDLDFIIYGWNDTAAEEYAVTVGEDGDTYEYQQFPFISLNYFESPEHPPVVGDADADRSCSATDALFVLKIVVGKLSFHESQLLAADLDGDGTFTAADALDILRIVVGKIPQEESFVPTEIDRSKPYVPCVVIVGIKKAYSRVNKIWTADDFPQIGNPLPSLMQIEWIEDLTRADTPEQIETYQNDPEFRQVLKLHLTTDYGRGGIYDAVRALAQNGYLVYAIPDYEEAPEQ